MRVSRNNSGILLAVVAGATSIAFAAWPGTAPQTGSVNPWLAIALAAGGGFLAAPFLAERHLRLAQGLLGVGGVVLLASALYFGVAERGAARSVWATLVDLVPAVLALAAVPLIGPVERHTVP
jgi:hypothetical protein